MRVCVVCDVLGDAVWFGFVCVCLPLCVYMCLCVLCVMYSVMLYGLLLCLLLCVGLSVLYYACLCVLFAMYRVMLYGLCVCLFCVGVCARVLLSVWIVTGCVMLYS